MTEEAPVNIKTSNHPITERPIISILRLEGLAVFITATVLYASLSGNRILYAVLFLVPDLSALGYLINARIGSWCYNLVHSYIGPMVFGLLCWSYQPPYLPLVLIWIAHIGIDRSVGYGLKSSKAFKQTHLSRLNAQGR